MAAEQERIYEALIYLANKVRDGAYGEGIEFDPQPLEEDIEEQVWEN